MNIDSDTEYKKYLDSKTESELRQIASSIDRSGSKKRYNMVMSRLKILAASPVIISPDDEHGNTNTVRRGWVLRVLLGIFCFIVGSHGFGMIFGILWARGETKTPWTTWESTIPFLFIVFCALSLYLIFSKYSIVVATILAILGAYFTLPFIVPFYSASLMLRGVVPFLMLCTVMFWPNLKKILPKIFGVTIVKSKDVHSGRKTEV